MHKSTCFVLLTLCMNKGSFYGMSIIVFVDVKVVIEAKELILGNSRNYN